MTLKIPIKEHRPEDLYAFLTKNIGKLSMLVSKGYAFITFEKNINDQEAIKKFQGTQFMKKRLFFRRINNTKMDEQPHNSMENEKDKFSFLPQNQLEELIFDKKMKLIQKIQNMFFNSIALCAHTSRRINEKFVNPEIKEKQIASFLHTIDQKLTSIESNYEKNMEKFFKYAKNFGSEPEEIDLEPVFKENMEFKFFPINVQEINFECVSEFKSLEVSPVKRLCALNCREFIVSSSMKKPQGQHGSIRFYDSLAEEYKENFAVKDGAYGLNVSNNVIFAGTYNSSLQYINLNDQKLKIQNSGILQGFTKPNSLIYEVKIMPEPTQSLLAILSMDQYVRMYSVSNDEIIPGVFSFSFEKVWDYKCQNKTLALQPFNEFEVLLGSFQKMKKIHIEKNKVQEIHTSGEIWKIKRFSSSFPIMACTASKTIELIDLRLNSVVLQFPSLPDKQIKCFETIPDHTVVYGAHKQIGVFDDRNTKIPLWKDSSFHLGPIVDIIKLEDKLISGDARGGIYSWQAKKW